jgi:hypothetical protein
LVLLAVISPTAFAQAPELAPGKQTTERAPDDIAPAARARASAHGFVIELRSDFGVEPLVDVEYANERTVHMNLNDGLSVALGWSFLPAAGGRLTTRLAAGVKLDMVRASNGDALFLAVPVDLMEAAYVGPLRLGAGASVLLWPRIRGGGFLEDAGFRFDPAPGVVADAEWIVAPRSRTGVGVRGSWYRYSYDDVTRWAPSVGIVLRTDLPVR